MRGPSLTQALAGGAPKRAYMMARTETAGPCSVTWGGPNFTAAQVRAAFRRGLGVSFARVAAEAHAYTRATVWAGG